MSIKIIETSIEKSLEILDGFLIPKEDCKRTINNSFDKVVVTKNNQKLTIYHVEDEGLYVLEYEPYKKKFITTEDHIVYKGIVKYAYFSPESIYRLKQAFMQNSLDDYINSSLKQLNTKPSTVTNICKHLLVGVITAVITAGICYSVYYLSNNPTVVADRENLKQIQDIGCDGHRGVKDYIWYPNINNIYICNDGTKKILERESKGLER